MRTFFVRSYCGLLAVAVMFYWLLSGAKTWPNGALQGNALGCIWRDCMAQADTKLGLYSTHGRALLARVKNTEWARRRKRNQVRRAVSTWNALSSEKLRAFETKR